MSIERALDPAIIDSVSQNVISVYTLLRKRLLHIDVIQHVHGIPFSQVQVLSALMATGEMSVSEISIRLGIAKSNITPMMDRLIANDYVSRVKDTTDRRMVNIVIMEKGKETLQAIYQTLCKQIMEWACKVSASDFAELDDALRCISKILSKTLYSQQNSPEA